MAVRWRQLFEDLSKTTIASIIATAADGVVFALLSHDVILGQLKWGVGVAAALAAIVGGIIHYSLCRSWVYGRFGASHRHALPRYVLMSGSAALLHGGLVQLLSGLMLDGLAWGASKVLIYLMWTFPLSRYVVFSEQQQEPSV